MQKNMLYKIYLKYVGEVLWNQMTQLCELGQDSFEEKLGYCQNGSACYFQDATLTVQYNFFCVLIFLFFCVIV